jgi:ComEC/Rec2-related protein
MAQTHSIGRRPLVGVAVLFVIGVATGLYTGDWRAAAVGWTLTATAWLVARFARAGGRVEGPIVLLVALATGWLVAARSAERLRDEQMLLREGVSVSGKGMVRGTVSGDVAVQRLSRGGARYRFQLRRVEWIGSTCSNRLCAVPVWVTWYGPAQSREMEGRRIPASGERWQFAGKLRMRAGALRRIRATIESREKQSLFLAPASLRDLNTLADRARQVTAARLARGIDDWGAIPALVQAMFLGTRSEIPRDLNRIFRDSGTVHIFAISGMNVALLAVVIIAAISLFGVPRQWWCVPLAPILLFYTVVTGLSASALRAFLMAVLYFSAPLLGRKPDAVSTLAAAAVIALAINPFQLQDAGFSLSFVVMGGLILFYVPLADLFRRWMRVDDAALNARAADLLGGELQPAEGRRLRFRETVLRYLSDLLAMSIAAWVSSSPLTAWYFGRLTPTSILANLPIAPAAFFVGVASSVGLAFGLVSAWIESVFNHAAGGMTLLMIGCARATVAIPGGTLPVPHPPVWVVGCWYAGVLLLTVWLWRLARRPRAGVAWLEQARDGMETK